MIKAQLKQKIRQAIQEEPNKKIIKKLALFGSHATGSATKKSDVDILVEFSAPIGLFGLMAMQRRLSDNLKQKVDLLTPGFLNKRFRQSTIDQSEIIYEQS